MRQVVPTHIFRLRARAAMKPVMSILLVVALIATLPSLIQSLTIAVTGADPSLLVNNTLNRIIQLSEQPDLTQAQMVTGMQRIGETYDRETKVFWQEKGAIFIGLNLMVFLCSPVLTLGLINALLHALRRQEFTPAIALSRVSSFFKMIGVELLMALRVFLWMLPGMAVMIAAAFLPEAWMMILGMLIGMVVMIVPGVRVAYRYVLAEIFLADNPGMRVRDCLRRSHEVMKGRRMEFFLLVLSFIGWEMLLSLVTGMLLGLLGNVVGMTLGQFAALLLTVYINCAVVAFYQEYAIGPAAAPEDPQTENAGSEPLN